MIFQVDPHSGVPVYRQLMEQVRFQVTSGLLEPGDEIPSTRTLSAQLGVNPMTVSRAFALLAEDGVLERRPGLPLVVRQRPDGEVRASRRRQLRAVLGPAVAKARQLAAEPDEVVEVVHELLDEERR